MIIRIHNMTRATLAAAFLLGLTPFGRFDTAKAQEASSPNPVETLQQKESTANSPLPATAGPKEIKAARAEYEKHFEAWKASMKKMYEMRIAFQNANEQEREKLQTELTQEYDRAEKLVPQVLDSSLRYYELAPEADPEIEKFLTSVVAHHISLDRYEEALKVGRVLLDQGAPEASLPLWLGLASFAIADYDSAEEYFAKARESGAFDKPPESGLESETAIWRLAAGYVDNLQAHRAVWEKEQETRKREESDNDLPRVLLKTTAGDITLELFENEAPITVKNFVTLVDRGMYEGILFHRVLPNFMAQSGELATADKPPLGYTIPNEAKKPTARKHFRGSLSMALMPGDPNSGSSGFYITFLPTLHLDGEHTVFGRVIKGMDVVDKITRVDPQGPPPIKEPTKIISAEVIRRRPDTDYSDFKKLGARQ